MKKTKKLILIGGGEFAQIAFEYFTYDSEYEVNAFAVDKAYIKEMTFCDKEVLAYEDLWAKRNPSDFEYFVAIPSSQLNGLRTRFYLDLKSKGARLASYVSSKAFVWRNAKVGENTFIFESNVIQPFVTVGNNCILWSGNHVGHRTVIEDHVFITSHSVISGYCNIGHSSFLGVNCTINDKIKVGHHCVIGSGALVVKDTSPEKLYVGSPAKPVEGKSVYDLKL